MIWFTADTHFGHQFVADLRGFASVQEHDEFLVDDWNSKVRPEDQVWVLGDVTLRNPEYALVLIDSLPGRKHLIAGNHDGCHPMHKNAHKEQRKYLTAFSSVQAFAYKKIAGQRVLMSHFPYRSEEMNRDHTEVARYPQYRLPDLGNWLLHGHTHSSERITSDHEIHVGLDAWNNRLVGLPEIERIINTNGAKQ